MLVQAQCACGCGKSSAPGETAAVTPVDTGDDTAAEPTTDTSTDSTTEPKTDTSADTATDPDPCEIPADILVEEAASYYDGQEENRAGYTVSGAGDVNGDGFDDILVGSYNGEYGPHTAAYLVLGEGAPHDLHLYQTVRYDMETMSQVAVAGAGDLDGDGLDDVLIAAGMVYLSWGETAPATASLDGEPVLMEKGVSVAGVGDTNGDGLDDAVVGAGSHAYVFHGSPERDDLGEPKEDGSILTDSNGTHLRVSGAGDVNGDGLTDYLVGHPPPISGEIAVLVLGEASPAAEGAGDARFTIDIDTLTVVSATSIGGGGDVDGDGLDDMLMGNPHVQLPALEEGFVALFRGTTLPADRSIADSDALFSGERIGVSVASGGDIDGDGRDDILFGGTAAHLVLGSEAPESLDIADEGIHRFDAEGHWVNGAGDFNADGRPDIVLGSPDSNDGAVYGGAAFLVWDMCEDPGG